MATFLNDTFTESSNTALDAHTGESGATWTEHPSYATGSITVGGGTGAARSTGGTSSTVGLYYASGAPAAADYTVTVQVKFNTAANPGIGPAARLVTGADTYYYVEANGTTASVKLFKQVAGVNTQLGSFAPTVTAGTTVQLDFALSGSSLTVKWAGSTVITATDSAITAAGKVGLWGVGNAGASAAWQADSITAVDAASGASGSGTPAIGDFSASGSGSASPPINAGSGSPTIGALSASGSGSASPPIYAGAGSPAIGALSAAGSGIASPPIYAGAGSPTIGALSASGSGSASPPGSTGSGSVPLGNLSASGSGIVAPPINAGSGSPAIGDFSALGSASITGQGATGSGSAAIGDLSAIGSGSIVAAAASDLREALAGFLASDATLLGLVGANIHPEVEGEDEAFPSLTFTVLSNPRGQRLRGPDGTAVARVEFALRSRSLADCVSAKRRLEQLLDGLGQTTWNGVYVRWANQIDEHDLSERADDGSDDWLRRVLVQYRINHRVAVTPSA